MRKDKRLQPSVSVLAFLLLGIAAIAPALAMWPNPQLDPPTVAFVDLERVFNEIDRLNQAQINVEQKIAPFQAEADSLRKEAERLKADLDMLVPGTEKYKKAEREWTEAVVNYRAQVSFIEAKLDLVRAAARAEIFDAICEAAGLYAQSNGID